MSRRVEVSPEVVFREVSGEAVLLDLATRRYFSLDETGTRMWALLAEHGSVATVCEHMVEEFAVAPEVVARDLDALVERLAAEGLVRVVEAG